jgi:hypothetical protein
MKHPIMQFSAAPVTSSILDPNIKQNALLFNNFNQILIKLSSVL